MALLLLGLNHKTAPVALRERLYIPSDTLRLVLNELQTASDAISELAIISTCNRFEVYAEVENVVLAHQDMLDFLCAYFDLDSPILTEALYTYQDDSVVQHLMAVACGLESMVLGEAQILGQVSKALENASLAGTTGAIIHRLFETAIHAGKRARTETAISQSTTSISHAAAQLMRQESHVIDPKVLILGAGEMAKLAVYAIHKYGLRHIRVLNRTYHTALDLAQKFGVQAYDWSEIEMQLADADVVISATGAQETIITYEVLQTIMTKRQAHPLLLIDIALPRDIPAEVASIEGVTLYDIDALQNIVDSSLVARSACVPDVKAIINQEADRYLIWLNERAVVPVIKELRHEVSAVIQTELNEALNKLPEMSSTELDVVKRMAHRITNKVLHAPTLKLRSTASDNDAETYATVVRELFALDIEDSKEHLP